MNGNLRLISLKLGKIYNIDGLYEGGWEYWQIFTDSF